MVMIRADRDTEAGKMPSERLLAAMGNFNEELVKAGVMQAGEGLRPSRDGARVHFSGERRTLVDGPFAETKELIAGFWLWQVSSLAEAIEWVKRCPNPLEGEAVVEIRPVYEADDFGAEFTPELREQEERLRAEIASRAPGTDGAPAGAPYVDGFVVPVPTARLDAYRQMADASGRIWKEHGALAFHECVADDVKPGQVTSFPQSVQLKDDETVVFSWIVFRSREHRDEVNAKVMADPRLKAMMEGGEPPFDAKRMFYGGFRTLVQL
jgi:uncharacterized protein YbaA (DUF1428 family)